MLAASAKALVLDSTSKSNRFDLQLSKIVSMTASKSTFFIAFTYLEQEKTTDFT
jgi:hypothetical protein